jgi:hypothetical protein
VAVELEQALAVLELLVKVILVQLEVLPLGVVAVVALVQQQQFKLVVLVQQQI